MKRFLSVSGVLTLAIATTANGQDETYGCEADAIFDLDPVPERHMGHAIATGGDFNGDGFEDLLVSGVPRPGQQQVSRVVLFLGPLLPDPENLIEDGRITFGGTLDGNLINDQLGAAVAFVPDIDGDGRDEIALGAPDWVEPGGFRKGEVLLILGEDISNTAAPEFRHGENSADLIFEGVVLGGKFGASLAATKRPANPGPALTDLLIGAPGSAQSDPSAFRGAAYVFHGIGAALPYPPVPTPLRISAPSDPTFGGIGNGDRFGHSVAYIGDIVGTDAEELIIGAPELPVEDFTEGQPPPPPGSNNGPGYARVFEHVSGIHYDEVSVTGLVGEVDGDGFGWALAGRIDVGNSAPHPDGVSDFFVSAFRAQTTIGALNFSYAGKVHVFSGAGLGPHGDFSGGSNGTLLFGDDDMGQFGYSLAGTASIDNDPLFTADILIGSNSEDGDSATGVCEPMDSQGGRRSGGVRVFSGTDGSEVFTLFGEAMGDFLGTSVGAGDLDAFPGPDLISGAVGWTPPPPAAAVDRGRAYLFTGPLLQGP